MFDANTTIHTEPQLVLHKTLQLKVHYMCVCVFNYLFPLSSFSLTMLKRNITYRNTVVHKKSNASFLFFFFFTSLNDKTGTLQCHKMLLRLNLVLQFHINRPFVLSSFLSFFCPARHVKDSYVGLTAKNTRDTDKHFALGKMFLSTK